MVHAPTLRRLLPFGLLTNNTTFISNQSRALLCSGCSQYRVAGDAPGNADDVISRNAVALDCEMLSCRPTKRWFLHAPPRKKKRTPVEVSVAGRCALVDYDYRVVYDSCIRPGPRTTVITNWKGIRPRDILGAPSLDEAREEILGLLQNKLVIAHDIRNDLAALQILLGVDLHPGNIRDTSNCGTLLGLAEVPANFPRASLRHLALRVLGRRVQTRRPHCPVEDAAVIMELYKAVENEWERQNSLH